MKKVTNFFKSTSGKAASAFGAFSATAAAAFTALADGTNEAVSAAQSLMSNVTSTLNITNIVAILGAGLTAVVTLYLAWWGAKKLIKMVQRALNGRLSIK